MEGPETFPTSGPFPTPSAVAQGDAKHLCPPLTVSPGLFQSRDAACALCTVVSKDVAASLEWMVDGLIQPLWG